MSIEKTAQSWRKLFSIPIVTSLALLVIAVLGIRWIVATQRAPGAMTITEAQGMDMTTSKPPPGVQPVAVESAVSRTISGATWFPATLQAYADEEVVARIPGRLVRLMAYPGDRVRPGQLLGVLDAPEYVAQAGEARSMAGSKLSMATAAAREQQAAMAMYRRAKSEQSAAESSIEKAKSESAAMSAERDQMLAEAKMADADLDEARASLKYEEANFARQQKLLNSGAISLDEFQMAQKERDMAVAKVAAAKSRGEGAKRRAEVADRKRSAAESEVRAAKSMYEAAKADADAAQASQLKAKAEAGARKQEYQAGISGAKGFEAMAGFRDLRALSPGVVSERLVAPGTSVMPGQVILRLKVMDRLRVQADIPQNMSTSVTLGQQVKVDIAGRALPAVVSAVFPSVNEGTRTFRIEAMLANPTGAYKAGSFVTIALVGEASPRTLAVRSTAIQDDHQGSPYVWVLRAAAVTGQPADWTCTMHPEVSMPGPGKCPICKMDLVPRSRSGSFIAERKVVTVGKTDGHYVEVLSGLQEGDQVIWAGFEGLQPGTPVKSVEWGNTGPKSLPSPEGAMNDMPGMSKNDKGSVGPSSESRPPSDEMKGMSGMQSSRNQSGGDPQSPSDKRNGSHSGHSAEIWTCTMHPQIQRPGPGECPICHMDLVKKEREK